MTFQPGQSGNPSGYKGNRLTNRHKFHREVFEKLEGLGHKDALLTLSEIQNDPAKEDGIRVAAASALAPFAHPKLQSLPVPRFITTPFEIPEFHTITDASSFLARIPVLVARGELDIDFGKELSAMASAWIEAKKSSEFEMRLTIVEQAMDLAPQNGTMAVVGGLPHLPGTDIIMPDTTNGHHLPAPDASADKPPLTPGPSEPEPDP
jgi:hypothetical protein